MNSDTGYIRTIDVAQPLLKKEIRIPDEEFERVINMNRKQRREWARKEKKRLKRNF